MWIKVLMSLMLLTVFANAAEKTKIVDEEVVEGEVAELAEEVEEVEEVSSEDKFWNTLDDVTFYSNNAWKGLFRGAFGLGHTVVAKPDD